MDYYPGAWDRLALTAIGLIAILVALISLVLALLGRTGLADRVRALAGGLSIGLGVGLAGGIGFLYVQSRLGGPSFFLAPYDFRAGFLSALELGALALLVVGALVALRNAGAIGLLLGTFAGLALFRLIFGPTAGFGGEVGLGVGREVGIMFGAAGGLLGGIVGLTIVSITRTMRSAPSRVLADTTPLRLRWRWPLIGLAVGALVAVLIAILGAQLGYFQFLVPYKAQIPDVPPDTSLTGMQHDFLFGVGMFAISGALIGCFLGLQWMTSTGTGARRHGIWLGVGLVVALICGLSFGLDHRGVGGPLLSTQRQIALDPAGAVRGLLIGLVAGGAIATLLLILARISRTHARWHALTGIGVTLFAGLLAVALPFWFMPFFAINIY